MPTAEVSPTAVPHLETFDTKFHRIAVAVDFSPQTEPTLAVALQVAETFHSELFLVNAATPTVYGTGAEPVPLGGFTVSLDIATACMAELVRKEPGLQQIPHREVVAYADAPELICRLVQDQNIDLVIAGSHGAHGLERLALGSIAERILRTARCPVLVIGPRADTERPLFGSILLAASLHPSGLRSAQYATSLAEHFHSKLTVVHVVEAQHRDEPANQESELVREMQSLIPRTFDVYAQATTRVEYGHAAERLASLAVCLKPSLVVTGARDEHTLTDHNPRSTVAELIQRAPCPVLCVREHFR